MSAAIRHAMTWGKDEDGSIYVIPIQQADGNWIRHAEYARLKAEVERLKEGNECLDKMHEKEMERSAWLREEFNRTTAWGRGLESDLSHARVEISFLKAEVERLTDAITRGASTPDAREVQS